MAELEARTTTGVIEICARTPSIRKCVFTSSLLACVWRRGSPQHRQLTTRVVVDESCWIDEVLCREKKLWFALGKTMAEKAAWRAARGLNLKMVALYPAILTGPGMGSMNSTATISYLKGAQELLAVGVLTTVDLDRTAESHVCVYEAMGSGMACGRYMCFDHVVRSVEEAGELERRLVVVPGRISSGRVDGDRDGGRPASWFELSGEKLSRLMSWRRRCNNDHEF